MVKTENQKIIIYKSLSKELKLFEKFLKLKKINMNNFFVLNDIGFIGVDNFRSRAYLQILYKNSILVSK